MVRETRHLWVGNLPDNIREDRIREHFKRYGRVQSVKVVAKGGEAGSGGGGAGVGPTTCAAVAFMDIRSAAKAHNAEHTMDERTLTTDYYEPAAIPSSSAGSSPAGSGYSAASSSASVSSRQAPPAPEPNTAVVPTDPRLAPSDDSGTCTASTTWRTLELVEAGAANYARRATTPAYVPRERVYRNGPSAPQYSSSPSSVPDRSTHPRWYSCTDGNASSEASGSARRRRRVRRDRSGSAASTGTGAASNSSRSSSSEPRSPPSSASSRTSSPAAGSGSNNTPRQRSTHQWTAGGIRALAICVRNLPARSSDSSLKDGLYHEYKKHGKVAWVKVVGQNQDRYAVVRFKKPSDVEKALEVSQDKSFFGCKISVAPYQGCDADDSEAARPYETDLDEYHPKATRTLFIGNLEKDVTPATLREKFKHYGRIIEIDVKKQSGGSAGYAFCQYASISSVVEAIRAMDGEYVGGSRVKLGFGKSMATTCVWMDGLTEQTEKQVAALVGRYGAVASLAVDRSAGAALAHYEQAGAAAAAVRDLRQPGRLMVDFASRECQEAFYEQLEKHAGSGFDATQARYIRYDGLRYEGGTRYVARSSSSSSVARRYAPEHYDAAGLEYTPEPRYRSYEQLGASNSPTEETGVAGLTAAGSAGAAGSTGGYEARVGSHRRRSLDSSPDERHTPAPAPSTPTSTNTKRYKEQHWSGSGRRSSGEGRNRSRSGSHSDRRRRISDAERRRHRRRRDESPASRAGTPLCDETPDGPAPAEPRKPPLPPRDRNHPPMSLPLPKFAAQVLRAASIHASPEKQSQDARVAEPASPARPAADSDTSSSTGSAPHSPSLEERIRSLDEKYEKWSGTRLTPADAADRGRFRHRLLDLDIKEVRPSEVVRSLLAKRSVFDEDLERLESSTGVDRRAGSPCSIGSPRSRDPRPTAPRTLQYPFPSHPPPPLPAGPPPEDASSLVPLPVPINVPCNLANVPLPPLPPLPREAPPTPPNPPTPPTPCTDERVPPIDGPASVSFPPKSNCVKIESKVNKDPRCVPRKDSEGKSDIDLCAKDEKHRQPVNSDNLDRRKFDVPSGKSHQTDSDDLQLELRNNIKQIDIIVNSDKNISDIKNSDVDKLTKIDKTVNSVSQIDRKHPHTKHISDKSHTELTERRRSDKPDRERTDHEREVKRSKEHSRKEAEREKEQRDKLEKERKEKAEKGRSDKLAHQASLDKLEWERLEFERAEAEKADKAEKERIEKEISDRERIERERTEKDQEKERSHREKTEREKMQREKSEKERQQREKADKERLQREKERALREAQDKERAEKELLEKERVERECKEKECAEKEKEVRLQAEIDQPKNTTMLESCDREFTDKEQVNEGKQNINKHDSRRERTDKEKRKEENNETNEQTSRDKRKETSDKHDNSKHSKHRKDHSEHRKDSKRDSENKCKSVSRKSSRDETARDCFRKDSSDSTASRASHDSSKSKEHDQSDSKEEKQSYSRAKHSHDRHKQDKEQSPKIIVKNAEPRKIDLDRPNAEKIEKKHMSESIFLTEQEQKDRNVITETQLDKQRHNSIDCPASSTSVDAKRKERLNSSCSLPSNIGCKRRISSHENIDSLLDDPKRIKLCDIKLPERRDSKEYKSNERTKYNKFKLNHTKSLEEKIKDDKKHLAKSMDREKSLEIEIEDNQKTKDHSPCEKIEGPNNSPKAGSAEDDTSPVLQLIEEEFNPKTDSRPANIEFLATLELRSSEEDEKQKALRKEMKEKKRIQQLQQIHELQKQQDAMQQADPHNKIKEDKKYRCDDRKKEIHEKRMSTERKSREEKNEIRKKLRKPTNSSDTSDSDEPKKHSIFDIVDEGPTYISMYDKVKARSCKNMQKQEEEKRQEKIKAKFSQLKQSRAKREGKKRSTSWDGDTDSDNDHKHRNSIHPLCSASSSDDDPHRHSRTDSETDQPHNKDRMSNCHHSTDHNDLADHDDQHCKLSRKNSRTRIVSDTSEDEAVKRQLRNMKTEPDIKCELDTDIKSELFSVLDIKQSMAKSIEHNLDYLFKKAKLPKIENAVKKEYNEKFSNNKINNLFNDELHTYGDTGETIVSHSEQDYKLDHMKPCPLKVVVNDNSSEGECPLFNSNSSQCDSEIRKKHKKRQKKQKCSANEDENKFIENHDTPADNDLRLKYIERNRKHTNKKEKKREKIRESVEAEDCKEVKVKKIKKPGYFNTKSDFIAKRDDKMQAIFGPLSEDSDPSPKNFASINKNIYPQAVVSLDNYQSFDDKLNELSLKEKFREESRKRKEKKRKERKAIVREDDNSLDVDAAGKAIEASLFADSLNENDHQNVEHKHEIKIAKSESDADDSIESSVIANELKMLEKSRRDSKERKKKKKKNREDRQSRREHHHHHDKATKVVPIPLTDKDISSNTSELSATSNAPKSTSEIKSALSSPSLPRLTESPPLFKSRTENISEINKTISEPRPKSPSKIHENLQQTIDATESNDTDVTVESVSVNTQPCPSEPVEETRQSEEFIPVFGTESDDTISQNAVKSISEFGSPILERKESIVDNVHLESDADNANLDDKTEKPRAVISQEETEDAVAALLGESFGGNSNSFPDYDNPEQEPTNQPPAPSPGNNLPEEDAEEMRQAVQNLNASELEMKPDTPLSENDLQIDTDTDDADEIPRGSPVKQSPNVSVSRPTSIAYPETKQTFSSLMPPMFSAISTTPTFSAINTTSSVTATFRDRIINVPEKLTVLIPSQQALVTTARMLDPAFKPEQHAAMTSADFRIPVNNLQHVTSAATPVISTTWAMAGNQTKPREQLSSTASHPISREDKIIPVTPNIYHLSTPSVNTQGRPVISCPRLNAPYHQVINQMLRPPQLTNLQPPTIKIPDQHLVYQKAPTMMISPRTTHDIRLHSPQSNPHQSALSPRLSGPPVHALTSPPGLQQRSAGQVTVVRQVLQPPLSPIQRACSVLVQNHVNHVNRLPVAPVLAPLSKSMHNNVANHQNKNVNSHNIIHPPKLMPMADFRKNDQRVIHDPLMTNKLNLSSSNLQQSQNPTVMAQNRLISMQNAHAHAHAHAANLNKFMYNSATDKRETGSVGFKSEPTKSETHNHIPFSQPPVLHIASVSSFSGLTGTKPIGTISQEQCTPNRQAHHAPNVAHSMNHHRMLNTVPNTSLASTEVHRGSPSVLSVGSHRLPPVVSKVDASTNVSLTSSVLNKVVMTPLLIKASGQTNIKLNTCTEPLKVSGLISTVVNSSKSNFNRDEKLECFIVKPVIRDMHQGMEANLKNLPLVENQNPKSTPLLIDKSLYLNEQTSLSTQDEKPSKQDGNPSPVIEKSRSSLGNLSPPIVKPLPQIEKPTLQIEKKSPQVEKPTPQIEKTSPHIERPSPQIEKYLPQMENPSPQIEKSLLSLENTSPQINQLEKEKVPVVGTSTDLAQESETKGQTDFEELLKDTTNEIKITMDPEKKVEISTPSANTSVPEPTLDVKESLSEVNMNDEKENIVEDTVTISLTPKPISEIFSSLNNSSKEVGDGWSAREVNIDSVIKKVEALCETNEINLPSDKEEETKTKETALETAVPQVKDSKENSALQMNTKLATDSVHENYVGHGKIDAHKSPYLQNTDLIETFDAENKSVKRGGGRIRGRKTGVSARSISKPTRGSASSRRARGKAKTERKTKTTLAGPNLRGDIYDFHEDSGDETDTSPQNKSEARPRLILTISKGPQSSPTNSITNTPVSSVGISREGTNDKTAPATILREEKVEEFISPSLNTRKSRRLQEKDGRNTVDDVIDDVVKNSTIQFKGAISGKDPTRRTTRQNGAKAGALEKSMSDLRKSPRGTKRTKDRRASETSLDSSDEKTVKKDIQDLPTDSKVPKLSETSPSVTVTSSGLAVPSVSAVSTTTLSNTSTTSTPVVTSTSTPTVSGALKPVNDTPIPFMKPPKKMLSEINAKMALGTFDKIPPPVVNPTLSVNNTADKMEVDSSTTARQEQQTKHIVEKPMELSFSDKLDKRLESNTEVRNCSEGQGLKESPEELIIDPVTGELICMKRTTDGGLQPIQVLPPGSVPSLACKPSVPLNSLPAVSSPVSARSTPEIEPTPLKLDYSVKAFNRQFNVLQGGNYQTPVSSVAVSTIQSPRAHYTLNVPSPINKPDHSIIQARLSGVNPGMPMKNLAVLSPSSSPNVLTISTSANVTGLPNMLSGLPNIVSGVPIVSSGVPNVGLGVAHTVSGVPHASPRVAHVGPGVPNVSPGVSGTANMGNVRPCVAKLPNVAGGVASVPSGVAGVAARIGQLPGRAALALPGASLPRGAHAPSPPLAKHVAVMGPQAPIAGANNSRVSLTSVPSGSPLSQIPMGDGLYGPHFAHQHYQAYQQHFRAAHESRATPSPYVARSPLGAEGSEAPSPPLELRRLPCGPARVVRQAHSPAAREPPPAHAPCAPLASRDPPPAHASRLPHSIGPAHASQVPREADSLQMLLRRYPVMWQGLLALKNDAAAVQMHFVHGNPTVANATLARHADGSTPPLRIAQRMRLEPVQLEAVHRKMQLEMEHCMLLALPCGRDHMDVLQQSTNLTQGFITYLQRKQAAGIVNVAPPGHQQAMYTVHIFPSCEFANDNLARIAPDLLHRVADIAHLLIVIATV